MMMKTALYFIRKKKKCIEKGLTSPQLNFTKN